MIISPKRWFENKKKMSFQVKIWFVCALIGKHILKILLFIIIYVPAYKLNKITNFYFQCLILESRYVLCVHFSLDFAKSQLCVCNTRHEADRGVHRKQSHAKPCKEISNVLTHLVKTRMENEIAPKKQLRLNTKQCSKTLKHVAQLYKATQMFSIIKWTSSVLMVSCYLLQCTPVKHQPDIWILKSKWKLLQNDFFYSWSK